MEEQLIDFTLGLNRIGDRTIVRPGFSSVLDGVDLRSGSIRSYPAPVKIQDAADTSRFIFEYRGRLIESATKRDYVTQTINGHDLLYYTEAGQYPMVDIDGTAVTLGLPAPSAIPVVVASSTLSPILTASVSATGGSILNGSQKSYRVAAETSRGVQIPCGSLNVIFSLGTNTHAVTLTWTAIEDAVMYHIFAGPSSLEQLVAKVGGTVLQFVDSGAYPPNGEYANTYESKAPYRYIYTLERFFNGFTDESGPSPRSNQVVTTVGRLVTIDPVNDGYLSRSDVVTISSGITVHSADLGDLTLISIEDNIATNGVKLVFNAAHGLTVRDKIRLIPTNDPYWSGKEVEVLPDLSDTTAVFVSNVPVPTDKTTILSSSPNASRVLTLLTLSTVPSSIINDDTAVYLTLSYGGVSQSAWYRATRINDTAFIIPKYTEDGTLCSKIQFVPNNGYIKYRNLYRTTAANGFFLVDKLLPWETSVKDTYADAQLGTPPSSYYQDSGIVVIGQSAPYNAKSLEQHYGMLFAIVDNTVRWTPVNMPHCWPEIFYLEGFSSEPLALKSFGGALIVLCANGIYRIDGNRATNLSLHGTHANDGCYAPGTVLATTEAGLIYVSRRGVMSFDGMHAKCITDDKLPSSFFTGTSFQQYNSNASLVATLDSYNYANSIAEDGLIGLVTEGISNKNTVGVTGVNYDMQAFYHNGKYYIYWNNQSLNYGAHTTLVIDLQSTNFPVSTLPLRITSAHVSENGRIYTIMKNEPYMSINVTAT